MGTLFTQMKTNYWQGAKEQALGFAAEILTKLDLDDEDDEELLQEVLECGLFEGKDLAILVLARQKGLEFSTANLAYRCVEKGCFDMELFAGLMELGADPYYTARDGRNLLHLLASRGKGLAFGPDNLEPFSQFLIQNLDLDNLSAPDNYGAFPLHYAALQDKPFCLKAMLEKGVEPDMTGTAPAGGFSHALSFNGVTPLMLACQHGKRDAAFLLLKHGADASVGDNAGRTAAFFTVMVPNQHFCQGYFQSIPSKDAVIARKAEILSRLSCFDKPDDTGTTPLLKVVSETDFDAAGMALTLIDRGADIESANASGTTALMFSAKNAHQEVLKALVTAGAELNRQNRDGDTALHLAARGHRTKQAKYLLKKGAGFDIVNNKGESAADIAAAKGLTELLELMM